VQACGEVLKDDSTAYAHAEATGHLDFEETLKRPPAVDPLCPECRSLVERAFAAWCALDERLRCETADKWKSAESAKPGTQITFYFGNVIAYHASNFNPVFHANLNCSENCAEISAAELIRRCSESLPRGYRDRLQERLAAMQDKLRSFENLTMEAQLIASANDEGRVQDMLRP